MALLLCATPFLVFTGPSATRWHELATYSFEDYKAEFGKVYATAEEEAHRKASFDERLRTIKAHNADSTQTYKRGVNPLTDRTTDELSSLHGLDRALLFAERAQEQLETLESPPATPPKPRAAPDYPPGIDWRRRGAVTPVKNQGSCGSCWSFASTEAVESRWFLKTGELQELSEQFILDCTPNPHDCGGSGGCGGGTAKLAYERLAALGGLPSEWTYPYLSVGGSAGRCRGLPLRPAPAPLRPALEKPHASSVAKAANVSGHVSLPSNSYDAIMAALVDGPLAVSVDAGAWHDYESGVFTGGSQSHVTLDHLVQLVGYGTDPLSGLDYFTIRNSWTPLWGEAGYMRLLRARNASCGVDLRPGDGDGCNGGPKKVTVCGQSGILYDGAKMRLVAIPAGLLPTQTHTLPACHPVGRCALRMNDYEEKPMENINKAGPSEQRREELRLLMQKMKESGKLGGTGMMSDMNEGGALEGSKTNGTATDSGEWFQSNGQWFKAEATGAQVRPTPTTPAESPPPISSEEAETATADSADDLLEDGLPKSTGSVGGRWVAPKEVDELDKLKPSVGSWGVFERPADISKAYGGGKKIGVGGFQEDEEERKRKQKAMEDRLRSYRASRGGDFEAEVEHKDDIAAARKESMQLSRMGELKGALKALQNVEPWLCDSTELGGRTLLELGWAYDATGDREMGRKIMARLRQHPSKEIRRMSQQLAFQDEASEFLGVKEFGSDGPSEYEKLSRLPRVKGIKRYNLLDAPTASLKRPPVDTLSEARMTLRSAAVRRGDNGAPTRLQQSITYITKKAASGNATEPLVPDGGAEGAGSLLSGTWSLALTQRDGKVSWAPRDARLELSLGSGGGGGGALQGTFERLAPGGGPGLYRTTGSVAVKPGARAPVLQLDAEECRLGPLPVPLMTRTSTERLLFLDSTMCVAEASSGDLTVLVRPKLRVDPDDGE